MSGPFFSHYDPSLRLIFVRDPGHSCLRSRYGQGPSRAGCDPSNQVREDGCRLSGSCDEDPQKRPPSTLRSRVDPTHVKTTENRICTSSTRVTNNGDNDDNNNNSLIPRPDSLRCTTLLGFSDGGQRDLVGIIGITP